MQETAPGTTAPRGFGRRWRWAAAVLILVAGAAIVWQWRRGTSPPVADSVALDPLLTFPTIYRNVRPEVKYVGDQVCAECHAGHSDSYQHHPMGQAMAPAPQATAIERYDEAAHNPFVGRWSGRPGAPLEHALHYLIERRGEQMFQREWAADAKGNVLAQREEPVAFVIGSGTRARSYAVSRDGYLFQAPATWYPEEKRWDLSPGYETRNFHFGRAIAPACLFCHCTNVEHVPGTVNRYQEPVIRGFAIGCERCHGPGELHVERRTARQRVEGIDDTIVNPAKLEHSLREAVCQQCHIQGEQRVLCRGRGEFDFRPGLPLHLFIMDFVDARSRRGDFKFVSSVEQMMASRCYEMSAEPKKLGCISCHDAHRHPTPGEKVGHYRQRCLQCHTETSCAVPVAKRHEQNKDDSCIACHMPRISSEVNHTAITDHRIPRRPEKAPPAPTERRTTPGPEDLVPFHQELLTPDDPETRRNLGMAIIGMLDRGPPREAMKPYADKALPLLEEALRRDPGDVPALQAKASCLWVLQRQPEALTAYEAVLAKQPTSETAHFGAGNVALELNLPEKAETHLKTAVAANPWNWSHHHRLAVAYFRRGAWEQAVESCRRTLAIEPANSAARSLLVQTHLAHGQRASAEAEYEVLRAMAPASRRENLRLWYEEQLRRWEKR
jgi:hypothetical protein